MADIDEVPVIDPQGSLEEEQEEDTLDFAQLLSARSVPKRGEKDFEHHGTKHQEGKLEASRQAMHDILAHTRTHNPKGYTRAFYYGVEGFKRDDVIEPRSRQGLTEDHVVLVESQKGPHFKTMGKSTTGMKHTTLWLLPEEAIYLVERGNLDLWWPSRLSFKGVVEKDNEHSGGQQELERDHESTGPEEQGEMDEGIPMSLQAVYALLMGENGERGKITVERYTVYANLKRNGFIVTRALNPPAGGPLDIAESSQSIFTWLFGGLFNRDDTNHLPYGPLVRPGMYRSYSSIYRQIAVVPRHHPSPASEDPLPQSDLPFRVIFELRQATRIPTYARSKPGLPDFRIAIVDAHSDLVPSLTQMTSLLESTPWAPPATSLDGKLYKRLQHGWRNVLLAVVDEGLTSYMRLSETAFGEEKLYANFDRGSSQGTKRGASRGGGRGRGRGRGRGGRGRGRGN